jgi:translation initiation factor IF-1
MGRGSKKGRLTSSQRKEINHKVVSSVLDDDMEGVEFGRVVRHLGSGHIRVVLANKREAIARIRNILGKRGSTPIVTDDIVVLSGRDFETSASTDMKFDVLAVMTRQEASKLEKAGRIPGWMMTTGDANHGGEEEDIFDHSEIKEEGEINDSDIDDI